MSDETKKQLNGLGALAAKVVVIVTLPMAVWIFNESRNSLQESMNVLHGDVKEISKDLKNLNDVVIRHDGDIRANAKDIERLERTKADKK